MSSSPNLPLHQTLQTVSSGAELLSSLQEFIKTESTPLAVTYRCKLTVDLFLQHRALIDDNKSNTDLIRVIGSFFLWLLPKEDDVALTVGKVLCRIPPVIRLFVEVLIPATQSDQEAIYTIMRSACRISHNDDTGKHFVLEEAAVGVLDALPRAISGLAIQWCSNFIQNVDLVINKSWSKYFVTPRAVQLIKSAFSRCPDSESIRSVGFTITDLTRDNAVASPLFLTKEYVAEILQKLEAAETPEMIDAVASVLGNFNYSAVNDKIMDTAESVSILLQALRRSTSIESLSHVSRAIGNLICRCPNIHHDIASDEMVDELVKNMSRAGASNECLENLMRAVSNLTSIFESARTRMRIPATQRILLDTYKATSAAVPKEWVISTIGNVMHNLSDKDVENLRILLSKEAAVSLVEGFCFLKNDISAQETLIRTINNFSIKEPSFLTFFSAHCPWDPTTRIKPLLETSTHEEFCDFIQTQKNVYYGDGHRPIAKIQGLFAFLEKMEDFVVARDDEVNDDDRRKKESKNSNHVKNEITRKRAFEFLSFTRQHVWGEVLLVDNKWDDTLALCLLPRATGVQSIEILHVIRARFWSPNVDFTPAVVSILLDKLEEETDDNVVSLLGATSLSEICQILEDGVTRHETPLQKLPTETRTTFLDMMNVQQFVRAAKTAFSKTKIQRTTLKSLILRLVHLDPAKMTEPVAKIHEVFM